MRPSSISTGAAAATTTPSALSSPYFPPPADNYASSAASNPASQTDLHSDLRELRAKAKRWARWSRSPTSEQLQGVQGPTGSAAETAVDVDLHEVVKRALRDFRLLFETLTPEWASTSHTDQSPSQTLEDIRPRIESNLDRIGSFQHGHDSAAGKSSSGVPGTPSHREFTKINILTLQKIDAWLQKSDHPLCSDMLYWLWRGVLFIFEFLTSPDNHVIGGLGTLGQFCRALQELSVVLPSSLYHVASREILQENQLQAVTGLIYADVLELVGSVVSDVILPGQSEQSSTAGGIRRVVVNNAREHHHHHHFTRWNQGAGISVNTNVPIATGSAPTSPTGSMATKKQSSLTQWKNHLRTILEQAGYHSTLLQRELNHLQERERSGRFRQITMLFDEIEEAEEIEKECRRNLREVEQSLGNTAGDHEHPNRRHSDSTQSSGSEPKLGEHLAGLDETQASLSRRYKAARQAKDAAYAKLREEAGHIKCDVCIYTAFENSGPRGSKDHEVAFSSDLREFSNILEGEGSGKSGSNDSEDPGVTTQRKALFKLYVTNDDTVNDTLKEIHPRFILNRRGRKALDEGPNLWSFARIPGLVGSNWRFIKTTLPNLEKGFGSEARRYAMEARDEKAYFYNSTWKIYWCQPRSHETTACPVAILVLAGGDLPLSRPVDPSPRAQHSFERARHELVAYYRHNFHVPLIERGGIISADNLAVQILGETKRRWREVLDKMRHFVDALTDRLYVQASNASLSSTMGVVEQRKAAEAMASYNHAAGQVFKILIKVNSYESMLIETMTYLSQLGDEDMLLGVGKADLLQMNDEEDERIPHRHESPACSNTRSQSRNGLLRTAMAPKVKWQDIKRSHHDLLESLRSTKRQADSLRSLIDHEHSMHESRVSNQHSMIANIHAAEATRQADEAAAQNASMRRLTVVTFIFLPLTFMASLFGANVKELGQGNVPLWMFFVLGTPFAALVLGVWGYMEFWRQGTKSEGRGGERSGRRRVEELEMEMQRLGEEQVEEGEGERGNSRGRGAWEGGDRMV